MAGKKLNRDRVIFLLNQKNMTQKALAEQLNYQESTISGYLKGSAFPKENVLKNMAQVLGTSVTYLTEETRYTSKDLEAAEDAIQLALKRSSPDAIINNRDLIIQLIQSTDKEAKLYKSLQNLELMITPIGAAMIYRLINYVQSEWWKLLEKETILHALYKRVAEGRYECIIRIDKWVADIFGLEEVFSTDDIEAALEEDLYSAIKDYLYAQTDQINDGLLSQLFVYVLDYDGMDMEAAVIDKKSIPNYMGKKDAEILLTERIGEKPELINKLISMLSIEALEESLQITAQEEDI